MIVHVGDGQWVDITKVVGIHAAVVQNWATWPLDHRYVLTIMLMGAPAVYATNLTWGEAYGVLDALGHRTSAAGILTSAAVRSSGREVYDD